MFDIQDFVSKQKSLLIAPAGYGKTHTISESLKNTIGRQLILTHTHAGVSSIKEKLKKAQIASHNFNVETITSFAQKYVLAFYIKKDEIPEQEDSNAYYPFIVKEAANIIKLKPIIEVISSTYSGLFVDEYQDCTVEQHKLILSLKLFSSSLSFPIKVIASLSHCPLLCSGILSLIEVICSISHFSFLYKSKGK